jgi:hypothetical protein
VAIQYIFSRFGMFGPRKIWQPCFEGLPFVGGQAEDLLRPLSLTINQKKNFQAIFFEMESRGFEFLTAAQPIPSSFFSSRRQKFVKANSLLATRVTKLGDFSSIGQFFYLGQFLFKFRSIPNFQLLFTTAKVEY